MSFYLQYLLWGPNRKRLLPSHLLRPNAVLRTKIDFYLAFFKRHYRCNHSELILFFWYQNSCFCLYTHGPTIVQIYRFSNSDVQQHRETSEALLLFCSLISVYDVAHFSCAVSNMAHYELILHCLGCTCSTVAKISMLQFNSFFFFLTAKLRINSAAVSAFKIKLQCNLGPQNTITCVWRNVLYINGRGAWEQHPSFILLEMINLNVCHV